MDTDSNETEIVFAKPFRFTATDNRRFRIAFETLVAWGELPKDDVAYKDGARSIVTVVFGSKCDTFRVQQTVEEIDAQYTSSLS